MRTTILPNMGKILRPSRPSLTYFFSHQEKKRKFFKIKD